MKSILAQETITDNEVKVFLDETISELKSIRSRVANLADPIVKTATEDVDALLTSCTNISEKIGTGIELAPKEREDLIGQLMVVKKNIERGIIEGVSTGIDKYISQLK